MTRDKQNGPAGDGAESENHAGERVHGHYIAALRRRREAAYRLPPLPCGHVDPWTCRHPGEPSARQVDGYHAAAVHLLGHGLLPAPNLPALREMWRRGGRDQALVRHIAERWEVAA
jgi:hypothetical protein